MVLKVTIHKEMVMTFQKVPMFLVLVLLAGCGVTKPQVPEARLTLISTTEFNNTSAGVVAQGKTSLPMALKGADPVSLFPKGIHDNKLGKVEEGRLDTYGVFYKGAVFSFVNREHMRTFQKDPDQYIPMIGGYCPGAMSMNRVTPGDPKHTFFIPEAGGGGIWGTFGSENGPIKWANMTSDERKQSTIVARENYRKRTGPDPGDKKVTVLR